MMKNKRFLWLMLVAAAWYVGQMCAGVHPSCFPVPGFKRNSICKIVYPGGGWDECVASCPTLPKKDGVGYGACSSDGGACGCCRELTDQEKELKKKADADRELRVFNQSVGKPITVTYQVVKPKEIQDKAVEGGSFGHFGSAPASVAEQPAASFDVPQGQVNFTALEKGLIYRLKFMVKGEKDPFETLIIPGIDLFNPNAIVQYRPGIGDQRDKINIRVEEDNNSWYVGFAALW